MFTLVLDMLRWLFALSRRAASGASRPPAASDRVPGADLIFRLKAWPQLPEHGRTAEVYRILSVMSSQPVNRQWLHSRCRMAPQQLDELLQRLVAEARSR